MHLTLKDYKYDPKTDGSSKNCWLIQKLIDSFIISQKVLQLFFTSMIFFFYRNRRNSWKRRNRGNHGKWNSRNFWGNSRKSGRGNGNWRNRKWKTGRGFGRTIRRRTNRRNNNSYWRTLEKYKMLCRVRKKIFLFFNRILNLSKQNNSTKILGLNTILKFKFWLWYFFQEGCIFFQIFLILIVFCIDSYLTWAP